MPQYKHNFWRYIPSNSQFSSNFKFVETIITEDDNVPQFQDYYCIDQVINTETGQIRIKNHSAPDYCISKFVGWSLELPPVEKANRATPLATNYFLRLDVGGNTRSSNS